MVLSVGSTTSNERLNIFLCCFIVTFPLNLNICSVSSVEGVPALQHSRVRFKPRGVLGKDKRQQESRSLARCRDLHGVILLRYVLGLASQECVNHWYPWS
jgi:hypothetical protein